ncbi:MAG: hypothetical protein DWQ01_19975 [Planctomycetota bacterium]|nr:MAG: hypothetical protein DWQ01_19975 [Planctomycetota bacterium]
MSRNQVFPERPYRAFWAMVLFMAFTQWLMGALFSDVKTTQEASAQSKEQVSPPPVEQIANRPNQE